MTLHKRYVILIIVVIVIVGIIYILEKNKTATAEPSQKLSGSSTPASLLKAGKYPLAPELTGISGYLNTDGKEIKISDYKGKVVLVDFWTYTCINCIRTLPHLTAWDRKYRERGLIIIGVHTPEFEFEKNKENVQQALEKYGVEYPVVQDNDYATWRAYENRYWPHKYLIDADGYIRYDHIGEGGYEETEKVIQRLLGEINQTMDASLSTVADTTPQLPTTPELYLGYQFALPRGQNIGNDEGLQPEKDAGYVLPLSREKNRIYLQGKWRSNADHLEALEENATIHLDFTAQAVNVVADALYGPVQMDVFINDKYISPEQAGSDVHFAGERAFIVVDAPQLYNVVHGRYGDYSLKLVVKDRGFTANAFTFG